jgi:hypothetical protein
VPATRTGAERPTLPLRLDCARIHFRGGFGIADHPGVGNAAPTLAATSSRLLSPSHAQISLALLRALGKRRGLAGATAEVEQVWQGVPLSATARARTNL